MNPEAKNINYRKALFYLTKILHMLFPDEVPNINMVTTEPHTNTGDKVPGFSFKFWDHTQRPLYVKKKEFEERLAELGIKEFDSRYENYIVGANNKITFIDSFRPWAMDWTVPGRKFLKGYSPERLKEAILQLSEDERSQALQYFGRLEVLVDEGIRESSERQ